LTCYGTCATDTVCVTNPVFAAPALPITFQDTVTIDHSIVDFGGNTSAFAVDPTDPNNTVVMSEKGAGAQTWAGTVVGDNGLATAIPFTANDTLMTVRVWSPTAGTTVRMKVENTANGALSVETDAVTTMAGQWETLVFNMKNEVTGTPALDLATAYDKVVMFFDFGNSPTASATYYWDDVMMVAPVAPSTVDLTFSVDMSQYGAAFTTAYINGSFNGWAGSTNPLADQGNGIWSGTITVPTNDSLEYKFTLDGWNAQENFIGTEPCVKSDGTNHNRFLAYGAANMNIPTVCFNSCTACPTTPPDSVEITFLVNSASITVDPTGLFLAGGGNFGNPGDNPMTDVNNDGVYEITVTRPKGFSSFYIFTNGNSGWGAKENLAGLPCSDPNNFDDRFLAGVWSDTTLLTCYETCATDTVCVTGPVFAAPALPVTFQDTVTIDHAIVDFGGNTSGFAVDPTDPNNTVVMSEKGAGAQTWAGTVLADNGLASAIPFTVDDTLMSVRVWSPTAGTTVRLKVENVANGALSVETDAVTTTAGQWETLEFNFKNEAASTPALDLATAYEKVVIFFDFGNSPTASATYYWDDVMMVGGVVMSKPDLPITFQDTVTIDHSIVDFGGNTSAFAVDPTDPNNTVVMSEKGAGAQTWAGTVVADLGLANAIPFTADDTLMSVRVWSPTAGTTVRLKVEDAADNTISVETDAVTTMAGQWETLVFNFKNEAEGSPLDITNTYDKVVVFFDFGNSPAASATYYWDDIMMTTDTSTSTNQIILDENLFSLQPNLVSNNYTNIHFSNNMAMQQASIGVFNALGQQVSNILVESTDVYRMNVSNLPSGMYYVNVRVGNKMATKRMVVVK
jgi:ribosomal protein L28